MIQKKKNIIHISHSELSGATQVVFDIFNLNKKNYREKIILCGPNLKRIDKNIFKIKKSDYIYLKLKKYSYFFPFLKLYSILKKQKPDVILIHNYQIFPSISHKIFYNSKLIYVDHKANNLKNFKDKICIFFMFLFADKIIAINKKNYLILKKKFKKRVVLISNPVNLNFFKKKNTLHKKKKIFKIGMASRINRLKLHKLIIDIFDCDYIRNTNIVCFFAGSGENELFLKNIIIKKNLSSKIKFLGELNHTQLKRWFSGLDLYVQATKGEGSSTSILQALSMELPVLGSNVNGIKELFLKKNEIGMTFNNTSEDLKKKILHFYNFSNESIKKLKKNGRIYVSKRHNSSKIKAQYLKLINKL